MTINWDEKLEFYNEVFETRFKTPATMRKNLYKRFHNLVEAGLKIDVPSCIEIKINAGWH